jgi:arylsulfatase A-like enzyme
MWMTSVGAPIGPNGQAERKAAGKPYVLTPNLDRLAEQGINFTRGYGCTVCSPAVGHPSKPGFIRGIPLPDRNDPDNAKKAIRKDDITMGDALTKAGYATGYWGKWGYGGSKDMQNPTIDNVQTLPTSHGYKFVVAELHHVRAHTFFPANLLECAYETKASPEYWSSSPTAWQGTEISRAIQITLHFRIILNTPIPAYCDDVYAFALPWIL